MGFPCDSVVKTPPANAGDLGSLTELGRFPGEGNGNPLPYSCLGNPMVGAAWWATVPGLAESWPPLSASWAATMTTVWSLLFPSFYWLQVLFVPLLLILLWGVWGLLVFWGRLVLLRTAFAASCRFIVVFSLSFFSYFLTLSLILSLNYRLSNNMLFSLHVVGFFSFLVLWLISTFMSTCQKRCMK